MRATIGDRRVSVAKSTLDKDLKKISRLESATAAIGRTSGAFGLALLFLVAVFAFTVRMAEGEYASFIIAAGVIGGYMALNIGANDVANNVGPAVGSKALTMVGALVVAAIFEAGGAIIAGGEVVSTVSKGIVDPTLLPSSGVFVQAMMSALLAGALWINLATVIGAPVSTTHSIVGGVLGAGRGGGRIWCRGLGRHERYRCELGDIARAGWWYCRAGSGLRDQSCTGC